MMEIPSDTLSIYGYAQACVKYELNSDYIKNAINDILDEKNGFIHRVWNYLKDMDDYKMDSEKGFSPLVPVQFVGDVQATDRKDAPSVPWKAPIPANGAFSRAGRNGMAFAMGKTVPGRHPGSRISRRPAMSLALGRMHNRVSLFRFPVPLSAVAALLLTAAAPAPAAPARHETGESVGYNGEEDGPAVPGAVARARLGLSVQSVTPDLAEALGLRSEKGAVVTAVLPGGPGEEAGVKRGDLILRVDDAVVRSAEGLAVAFSGIKPGRETDLTLMRGIKTLELSITPRAMPPAARGSWDDEDKEAPRGGERLGVKVADPDRWLRRRYGIGPGRGVVVLSVAEGSRAQAAGIQEGDLIVEADRRDLRNSGDLLSAVARGRKRGKLLLSVRRGEDVLYVPIRFN
jgi:hypothetical protein